MQLPLASRKLASLPGSFVSSKLSRLKTVRLVAALLVTFAFVAFSAGFARSPQGTSVFVVPPYVQLGSLRQSGPQKEPQLTVIWASRPDSHDNWLVEYRCDGRTSGSNEWQQAVPPQVRQVNVRDVQPFQIYSACLSNLVAGKQVHYRLMQSGQQVFAATATAPKAPEQNYTFAVFGDCGCGSPGQKKLAWQIFKSRPDFAFIPGDIVYTSGRISEYLRYFFPVYNRPSVCEGLGVPLMSGTVLVAAPGNHDTAYGGSIDGRNLNVLPDALAYFMFWSQPLNGPLCRPNMPEPYGAEVNKAAFLMAAGANYPRMANFSFDYGNCHWTVLDANEYMDWTDPHLRQWLDKDLASARHATWKFVGFHQPGFNSDASHFGEQRMRLLADIFEKHKVDIVFSGHSHTYQRSYPLRFAHAVAHTDGTVSGSLSLDKSKFWQDNKQPDGVIYIISGAGGAHLSGGDIEHLPEQWQTFTTAFASSEHSFSRCEVDGGTLKFKQVSASGKTLDSFSITKPGN